MPQPPTPEKTMQQYIREDFARLQAEVSSFLGDVPLNHPDRLIVDLCFDRVAQSVRVIDQEHQNKKEAKEIIADAARDSAEVLSAFDKKTKEIKDNWHDAEGIDYLLAEIKQDMKGLVRAVQEAHELLKKEENNGSHGSRSTGPSEGARSLFGLSL